MGLKQDIIYAAACISLGLFAGREIGIYNSNNSQKPQVVYHQTLPKEETHAELRQSLRDTASAQYESAKALDRIDKGLESAIRKTKEMTGKYEGTPGLPGDTGIGDLFPGPGQKKKSNEDIQKSLRESYENFDRTYKKIQEDLKSANEHVRQIRENTRIGMKALEDGMAALRGGGGKVPNVPEYNPLFGKDGKPKDKKTEKSSTVPDFPKTPVIDENKSEGKK